MGQERYLSDEQIVCLYFERDEDAIGQTDFKYGKLLYTLAYRCVNDAEIAKECQNDTYLQTWNRIPPTRPQSLAAFLCKIARCVSVHRYKQMSRGKRISPQLTVSLEELSNTLSSSEEEYDAKMLGRVISEYVKGLSVKQRYIFMERYYMAGSVSEIAAALRLTESAVYKELTKIKLGLKMHLERNEIYI